jgi:hypothetical protein
MLRAELCHDTHMPTHGHRPHNEGGIEGPETEKARWRREREGEHAHPDPSFNMRYMDQYGNFQNYSRLAILTLAC